MFEMQVSYQFGKLTHAASNIDLFRCNVGKKMISVTSRTIKKGEEIHDCYGLPWYSKSREVRQEITSKFYKFTCQCPACEQHWTTSDMLATLTLQVDIWYIKYVECWLNAWNASEEHALTLHCTVSTNETMRQLDSLIKTQPG